MNTLRQLTPREVMFVGGETPNVYQHTAGLIMMDTSAGHRIGYESFRRHTQERLAGIPQFHWRLHEVPFGLDLPYWVEDEQFSFDHHIRRIAIPSPGDHKALGEVVSHLYCRHLDRSRPLWELWFIEGLADGRIALLQKMHHCMMDGQGASKLGETIWDFEPTGAHKDIDPAIAEARPGEVPDPWQMSANTVRHLSQFPLQAGREVFDAVKQKVFQQLSRGPKQQKKPGAPNTRFNADIGSDRGFVFGSLPLDQIKAVKSRFDVTVNDVALALVGGSMRHYLQARGELPDESLRTSIAVSLRSAGDDDFSNKVTTAAVTLATALADPVDRLLAIAQESTAAKEEAHSGHKGVLEIVQIMPPLLVNTMIRMTPGDKVAGMMGVNVVVSNVRGSPKPMYIAGARIDAVYPMSIIAPGGGINFTCFGYADGIHFGCTIEPSLVPEPWLIIDGLHETLAEYMSLLGKRPRTATKAGKKVRRKVAPKKVSNPKVAKAKRAAPKRKRVTGNTAAVKKKPGAKRTAAPRKS